LPGFVRPELDFVANGFPARQGDTFMDTWYFLENALIKLPWVAHLTQSEPLRNMFGRALVGARRLAQNCSYVFPLFADASDWRMRGSLLNPGVSGLYAAGCVLGSQLFGKPQWLIEAANALEALHTLPPHMLTHEPQQLSFGAAAAMYLAHSGEFGSDERWHQMAADLVRLSLRMGYWGSDPAVPFYDARGMFQACASLCYPAYKENIETLLPWSELLREDNHERTGFDRGLTWLMAAFANLARCHNYAFFDPYLPSELRRGPCAFIPYEDLATSEFPHAATLGKELYGAGEVFWSALLFDALGSVDSGNADVLCLSLDVPALDLACVLPRNVADGTPAYDALRFLIYNPANDKREVKIATPIGSRELVLGPSSVTRLTVQKQ
jgi:hypothetical protein